MFTLQVSTVSGTGTGTKHIIFIKIKKEKGKLHHFIHVYRVTFSKTRVYTHTCAHVLNRKKKLRIVVRYNFTVASKTLQIANQINRRVVQI